MSNKPESKDVKYRNIKEDMTSSNVKRVAQTKADIESKPFEFKDFASL